jgi:3-oxoacyl-[acyl-carrier protein] reductase
MLEIKDSVAVITGGSGGLGSSLAKYWVSSGGNVVLASKSEDKLAATESKLRAEVRNLNGELSTVVCDVTEEEECSKLADFCMERYGRINLVAPFAGITKDGLMLAPDKETGKVGRKMSLDQFQSVVNTNLTGVFLTVRECVERMINNNCKGLVCLVSSTGSMGTAGQINYSSTKAAMSVMPKVMTAEFFRRGLADKIRCVAVAPGYVATPMVQNMNPKALNGIVEQVPIGRLVDPEEVSSFIGELYRNEAIAGDVFFIHGGLRLGAKG